MIAHARAETAIADPTSTAVTAPLTVTGLAKTFARGRVPVFSGVSFSLAEGQRLALIGANGTGKSTLLRCCLRLIEPDAGSISLLGADLDRCRGSALRRARAAVGMVYQKHHLVPRLSVLSNVMHGALARRGGVRCWYQSLAPAAERDYAMHCLDLVGLADLAGRRADCLSGGQSQRVAIARALMQRPRLLFADEPAASLDPVAGDEVMALFARLTSEGRMTTLFVSHHLEHALAYADRILGLRGGGLALDTTPRGETAASLRGLYG